MTENGEKRTPFKLFSQPRTQASLFHYIKETPDPSVWEGQDWSFLRHPIQSFKEARRAPRTKASLFHYVEEEHPHSELPKVPFSWKEFIRGIFTGSKDPDFLPSVFSDPEELLLERAKGRTRKMEAGVLSLFVHAAIVGVIIFLYFAGLNKPAPKEENTIFVSNPMETPFEGDGRDGGGGGGGGKQEKAPPAAGRMPETTRLQMMAPDPEDPKPLMPVEDILAQIASVQMPIDIPQDQALPIGDIFTAPNRSNSSGSGTGGGIGTGTGTGVGSGTGSGVGPGSGGGMGGGSGEGIGSGIGPYVAGSSGIKNPEPIQQPRPPYTEEGRKARAEGEVLLNVVVRKDGSVDSFKIMRGLGYGLDEQAIKTISSKWKFKPGTRNGMPVDVSVNIQIAFRIY
jgi:TonB family protein